MFKKILIANRGEIAVRIVRTCREMGIRTLALYEAADMKSLHVRLADECVQLNTRDGFMDVNSIIGIAKVHGADAIHPGYGFLAERPEFIRACEDEGITFIGPSSAVVNKTGGKLETLEKARAAGFTTVENSPISFGPNDVDALREAAEQLSYPFVIKSCSGGRGRGERLVRSPKHLDEAMRRSLVESRAVFGNERLYLERAILPAHQVGVQILADKQGNVIHLGEREGSIIQSNQKIIEESPAPCLNDEQRVAICETAVNIARLCNYENAGTVEFLVNGDGTFYFSEIKSRIQVEHPVSESRCDVDIVREQIRIAAGQPLEWTQESIILNGWSMLCRINAEDPWQNFMPSPGLLETVRLPGGPKVRVDTYVYSGCCVPAQYVALVAKLTVWAQDRETCLQRMRRALEDFQIIGTRTNVSHLQQLIRSPAFIEGNYNTGLTEKPVPYDEEMAHLEDLAVAAAVYFTRRNQLFAPSMPEQFQTGWHKGSRRLPQ
ncbi:MAG: ATP-grasp domain-containing protein [Chloroflexi bacterium]|nr:ATP-grasp domain-containing protein [Chloroflexota bacterium]